MKWLLLKVPIWTILLIALGSGGLGHWARTGCGPSPQPIPTITHKQSDKPLLPEKIEERPTPVPQAVTTYAPLSPEVVRDTVILVPTGLKHWVILPTKHDVPQIVISHRRVEIPTYEGGVGRTFTYDIPPPPDRLKLRLMAGSVFASGYVAPVVTGRAHMRSFSLDVGVGYNTIDRKIAPYAAFHATILGR